MDWTRGQTIGYGSSATVSLAISRHHGDVFAVKSAELSQSEFLQREQRILSSLSCPYVVSYKGCEITEEDNKLLYNLFMEYAPLGTLMDAINRRNGRLDDSVIGFYTRQIVRGLEYLHSQGLVHCDIKARNILIGRDGAKIADFGCAKRDNVNLKEGAAVTIGGTPMFMAPEVARGEEQGFPCDIWALGCTVIEMATGGTPWPNETDPVSVLYRIGYSGELPEIPSFLSHQAKDFLEKCLRRSPKERWTANQLLKHPFIGESNFSLKQIEEFYSESPTSILDQGVWSSMEETQFQTPGNLFRTNSSSMPADRIGRLSMFSGEPRWTGEENWITIRENDNELSDEADVRCGSTASSSSDVVEDEQRVDDGDGWLRLLDESVSLRINIRICLGDRKCRKGSVVISNIYDSSKTNRADAESLSESSISNSL